MINCEIIENIDQKEAKISEKANQTRKILQETVENLRILCHISILTTNNGKILYRYLKRKDAELVLGILRKFEKQNTTIEHDIETVNSNANNSKTNICNDFQFARVVDLILRSKCIKEYLRKVGKPSQPSLDKFISYFIQLDEIIYKKLKLTAADEVIKENELKQAFVENKHLKNKIKELEEILTKQQSEFDKEHEQYQKSYNDVIENLTKLEEKFNFDVQQLIYESENSMMQLSINAENIQIELEQEVEKHQQQYNEIIEKHLKEEKSSRIAVSKIQTQLRNWIEKYDKDMMEKLTEFETLQNEYDQEMEQIHEWEKKLAEQNDEYVRLMQEKHDEEERIFQERLTSFIENRAAKVIQRAWRQYLMRQRARKLARKKKTKKNKKKTKK